MSERVGVAPPVRRSASLRAMTAAGLGRALKHPGRPAAGQRNGWVASFPKNVIDLNQIIW